MAARISAQSTYIYQHAYPSQIYCKHVPAGKSGFVEAISDAIFSDAMGSLRAGRPPVTGARLKFDILAAKEIHRKRAVKREGEMKEGGWIEATAQVYAALVGGFAGIEDVRR